MPRGDRTGPQGQGPMTGRGMGGCGADSGRTPGTGKVPARGRGQGMGQGRGLGQRIATGFNNLRQRARGKRSGRGGGRGRNNA
ncbi:MAG: DUF5320 domain-containing protein [Desulfobacterales bacterium]|nr:DUF5320 domain-containing protein [Desulfobacterales bacterium]